MAELIVVDLTQEKDRIRMMTKKLKSVQEFGFDTMYHWEIEQNFGKLTGSLETMATHSYTPKGTDTKQNKREWQRKCRDTFTNLPNLWYVQVSDITSSTSIICLQEKHKCFGDFDHLFNIQVFSLKLDVYPGHSFDYFMEGCAQCYELHP